MNTNMLQVRKSSFQKQVIKKSQFDYLLLGKAYEEQATKQTDQGNKQVEALQSFKVKEKSIKIN